MKNCLLGENPAETNRSSPSPRGQGVPSDAGQSQLGGQRPSGQLAGGPLARGRLGGHRPLSSRPRRWLTLHHTHSCVHTPRGKHQIALTCQVRTDLCNRNTKHATKAQLPQRAPLLSATHPPLPSGPGQGSPGDPRRDRWEATQLRAPTGHRLSMKGESQRSGKARPSRKLGAAAATLEPGREREAAAPAAPVLRRTRKRGHRLAGSLPGTRAILVKRGHRGEAAAPGAGVASPHQMCNRRGRGGLSPTWGAMRQGLFGSSGGTRRLLLGALCPPATQPWARAEAQKPGPQGSAVNRHLHTVPPGLCVLGIRPGC